MNPKKLLADWREGREEYFRLVEARDEEVRNGVEVNDVFKREEKQLGNKLRRLRVKLARFFPEDFPFGRKTKAKVNSNAKKQGVCGSGDQGYWFCPDCEQTFAFDAKLDGDNCSRHLFFNCEEHKDRKVFAKMSLKPVLDWCL